MGQITQTTSQLQTILDNTDASNAGKTSLSDASDTTAVSLKKSGFYSLAASSSNAPSTDRSVLLTAVRDTGATGEIRYGQVVWTESNGLWWNRDDGGSLGTWYEAVATAATQTLTNKTLTSPVLTTPQINDTSSDHQYIFAASELVADRTVTLPLLTGNDTFVFEAHTQTLTNKTLTSAVLNTGVSGSAVLDSDTMSGASATTLATSESIKAYVDAQVGSYDTLAEVLANGNTSGGTGLTMSSGDDLTLTGASYNVVWDSSADALKFADNAKATFGDGDLQIYHDGSNSYITDSGTGNLRISGTLIQLNDASFNKYLLGSGDSVTLYHADSAKLATTSTGIDVTGTITFDGGTTSADLNFGDNDKAVFGTGSDLQIYHDGSSSFVSDQGSGNLRILAQNFVVADPTNTEAMIVAFPDGSVDLYYDNAKKLATTSTGIDVTGSVVADGLGINITPAYDLDIKADNSSFNPVRFSGHSSSLDAFLYTDSSFWAIGDAATFGGNLWGGNKTSNYLTARTGGTERMRVSSTGIDVTGNITLPDNGKAIFGAGSDLQIYHDPANGNRSVINESGGGSLHIQGTNLTFENTTESKTYATFVDGGAVTLFHNNSATLATTTSGIDVTGNMTVAGASETDIPTLRIENTDASLSPDQTLCDIDFYQNDASGAGVGVVGKIRSVNDNSFDGAGELAFHTGSASSLAERMRLDSSGRLGIGTSSPGNLIEVAGASPIVEINATSGSPELQFSDGGTDEFSISYDTGANQLKFIEGGVGTHMVIEDGGKVGIGTSSVTYDLTVVGSSNLSTIGTNDAALRLRADGARSMQFYTNSSERMRLDASGNLGVGITSPASVLDLRQTNTGGTTELRIYNTDNSNTDTQKAGLFMAPDSRGTGVQIRALKENADFSTGGNRDVAIAFYPVQNNNRSEAVRISSQGYLGLGTDAPERPFHVLTAVNTAAKIESSDAIVSLVLEDSASTNDGNSISVAGDDMYFTTGGTERVRIDSSGLTGIGTSSPSTRLHVYQSTGNTALRVESAAANSQAMVNFKNDARRYNVGINSSDAFVVEDDTASTTPLTIDTSGWLGIGTGGSIAARLHVQENGEPGANGSLVLEANGASRQLQFSPPSDAANGYINYKGGNLLFKDDGTEVFRFQGASAVVVNEPGNDVDFRVESSNSTHALFVQGSSGNIGIGASSPGVLLDLESTNPIIRLTDSNATGTPECQISGSGGDLTLEADRDNEKGSSLISFKIDGGEKARLDSSGRLLVGRTSTAGYKLDVLGDVNFERTGTSDQVMVVFTNGNGAVGTIKTNGSATAYNTSSDKRLKDNITDANSAGTKIDAIQVRQFDWKADGTHQDYGMIAQELQEVAPEAVTAPEDPEEMMGVDYSKLVPMLVKEIQDLRARVAELES